MATGPQNKRKELREKRLAAEAKAQNVDKRQNLIKILGITAVLAVVAVVIAVVAIGSGDDDKKEAKAPSEINQLFAGIPQNGTVLGKAEKGTKPADVVTLIEFGDLQCPVCKAYADEALPQIINGPIKRGDANFDFRQWAILGDDSQTAARAALAAAEQNRYWQFLEYFYANQGLEGTGYVTDDFLTDIAKKAGVPDIDQWNADREDDKVYEELERVAEEATVDLGLSGTPSFAIQVGDGPLEVVQTTSPATAADELIKAINDAKP